MNEKVTECEWNEGLPGWRSRGTICPSPLHSELPIPGEHKVLSHGGLQKCKMGKCILKSAWSYLAGREGNREVSAFQICGKLGKTAGLLIGSQCCLTKVTFVWASVMRRIRVYPENAASIKPLHAFPSGEASNAANFEQGTFQHAVHVCSLVFISRDRV